MELYTNVHGISGIRSYEIGDDRITVCFRDRSCYLYTYSSAGIDNIEKMKSLAKQGYGLNSFIMRFVRKKYEKKFYLT